MLKDSQGFYFCFYSAKTVEMFNTVIKSLPDNVTWEIVHNA